MIPTPTATILACDGSGCANTTFTCKDAMPGGPYFLCEIDCAVSGACHAMTLKCAASSPCRLNCQAPGSCDGSTTLECNGGPCDLVDPHNTGAQQTSCPASCCTP